LWQTYQFRGLWIVVTSNVADHGCYWQYPVPPQVLLPTRNPTYYADLIAELEQAPSRSWWQRTVNRWKGFIRWS